jgi:hypothetical protein
MVLNVDGKPISAEILNPNDVAKRVRRRTTAEYEDISKRLFRMADFGVRSGWPKNITDDLVQGALLLAEVYVAKREGIIANA